jgi:hypothetical protein
MLPLSDTELSYLCLYLSTAEYIYYPVATNYFSDLYNTGCRPKELLAYERWAYIDDANIILTPFKGNSNRTFTINDISSNLLFAIINQVPPYDELTYRQLKAVLYKIIPVLLPQTADKSAIDYMFRYNKVKQLASQGKTDAEIQAIFGWFTLDYATLYRTQSLFTSTPVPEFIYPTITDDAGNYLIDDAGNILVYE